MVSCAQLSVHRSYPASQPPSDGLDSAKVDVIVLQPEMGVVDGSCRPPTSYSVSG